MLLEKIMYVYSDTVNNTNALEKAVKLAQHAQAKLTVLFTLSEDTLPDNLGFSKAEISEFIEQKEQEREAVISQYAGDITIEKESIFSNKYLEVINKVKSDKYNLIIKPQEDEGLLSKLFGSNDMGFLRHCPCPVWIIKEDKQTPSNSIIAAVDVSSDYPEEEKVIREKLNVDVLRAASSLAAAKGYKVKVVSVWTAQYENTMRRFEFLPKSENVVDIYLEEQKTLHYQDLEAFIQTAKSELGEDIFEFVAPEKVSLKGEPRDILPEYANQIAANLVVMGTVARVGIPGLIIGNTAESILNRLNCSVLAIKPRGFE